MTTAAIQQQNQGAPNGKSRYISWNEFQKRYLSREDGSKYEWVNGTVVKSRQKDYTQFYIVQNLLRAFEVLRKAGKAAGMLIMEGDSGVQVVWHIFPQIGQIHIYSGKKLKQMTVCQGNDACPASPVLPGFVLAVSEILRKPPMPV